MKTILLTMNQFAIIDDEDYERVVKFKWCVQKTKRGYYARRNGGKNKKIYLHRYIMNASNGTKIDHKDNNGLNCQKNNLRFYIKFGNSANSRKKENNVKSKYKGVTYCKYCHTKQWRARIKINGKQIHLGYYKNEKDAALEYNKSACKYFGEFALINIYV